MRRGEKLTVVFTAKAESDVVKVLDYTISEWGVRKARNYIDMLEQRVYALAENPKVGVERDKLSPGVRSFPIEKHVVFYLCDQGEFVVLRVLHQSMDPVKHGV